VKLNPSWFPPEEKGHHLIRNRHCLSLRPREVLKGSANYRNATSMA
jgi:hypothetical protein